METCRPEQTGLGKDFRVGGGMGGGSPRHPSPLPGFSVHPLPPLLCTNRENICMEGLMYSQQKQDLELTVAQLISSVLQNPGLH